MGIWLDDGISNRILSLLPLGLSFKSSLGQEHPPVPCHRRVIGPAWAGLAVSPALHVALIHTMVHRWGQERPVGNKPALQGQVCWEPRPAWAAAMPMMVMLWEASSSSCKDHALQADPCSFSLCFGPQILCAMGSWGTKPTKKTPKQNPHPLCATTCSFTIV